MDSNIKMVIHCGEKTIEVDERTLYDTGTLRALATHFENSSHPFWWDVFNTLAELAHGNSCDDTIASDQFLEHLQLANHGWDHYSVARQRAAGKALREKLIQQETAAKRAPYQQD